MRVSMTLLSIAVLLQPASSSWWYFSEFDPKAVGDRRTLCDITTNFNRKQRQICYRNPHLVKVVGSGVRKGISECQFQFRYKKWNCSTFADDTTLFGRSLVKGGTREIAFIQAITTASAVYKLARTCSKGHPKCGCSSDFPTSYQTQGARGQSTFKWAGCDQVVTFSTNFVRRFVDASEYRQRDGKAKITLHNNRVGRIMVRKSMRRTCKCHGLSGSCSMQTCWETLPKFRVIGDIIRERHDSAVEITFKPSGRIIPVSRMYKMPSKYNLIYYQVSPDFCRINRTQGSVGTHKRRCQNYADGEESCDILCCGQKYDFTKVNYSHHCECRFTWCCHVECKNCTVTRTIYTCK